MNIFIKHKKSNILFLTFIASITLFSLKKINYESNLINNSINNPLRSLIDRDDSLTRCEKAEKSLKDLYKIKTYVSEEKEKEKELDKYQEVLINFIREQNLDIAKDYIKRLIIPIVILGLAIITLFFWIGFCGCSCYPCGCCKGTMEGCGKCSFTLTVFFNSIALVVCIAFIILFSGYYFQSINNPVCSLYKFTFHLLDGTNGDYSKEKQWHSLDNLNLYIKDIQEVIESVKDLQKVGDCGEKSATVNKEIQKLKDKEDSFTKLSDEVINVEYKIKNLFDTLNDMKDQYLDDINKIMVDYIDKYYRLGLDGLFAVIGVVSLFALIALIASITCNCLCVRIFYHFIWNLQIIIAFIMILVAACLNVVGIIGKDSTAVLQYVKSEQNIKSEDPLFINIDGESSEYLITCLNGNGDLGKYFTIPTFFELPINVNDLKNIKETLENVEGKDEIIKTINNIIDISDKYEKVNNNIGGGNIGNCRFLGLDVDILKDQLKNSLGRDFTILSYIFLGEGVFIVISIFFGIIVINKYSKVNDSLSEENVKMVEKEVKIKSGAVIKAKEKMDSSDIPIKA